MTKNRQVVKHGQVPESHRKTEPDFNTCTELVHPYGGGTRPCMQVRPCPEHEPARVMEPVDYSSPIVLSKEHGVGDDYANVAFSLNAPAPGLNPKDLIGASKPDVSLIPPAAILHESQAMALGAKKYGPGNWRESGKPVQARTYLAAAMRHIMAVLDGEDLDPESGGHHLGHARASLGIYLDAMECGQLVDNRLPKGPAPDLLARMTKKG